MSAEVDGPSGQDFVIPPSGNLPGLVLDIQPLPPPLREVPIFSPAIRPEKMDEGNENGFNTEQRVGILIGRLPYVAGVRQAEVYGSENADLIDLIVDMIPSFAVPRVNVQVKSSHWGNREFYDKVAKRMRAEGLQGVTGEEGHADKIRWMQDRGLVLINGGVKDGEPVTDGYIIGKFRDQVQGIVARQKVKKFEHLGALLRDFERQRRDLQSYN